MVTGSHYTMKSHLIKIWLKNITRWNVNECPSGDEVYYCDRVFVIVWQLYKACKKKEHKVW